MDALWAVVRQAGVPEEDITRLRAPGWDLSTEFGITNKIGNVMREILIAYTGLTATEIENEYAPATVTSFATGSRPGIDEPGDGPGFVWNFLFCLSMGVAGRCQDLRLCGFEAFLLDLHTKSPFHGLSPRQRPQTNSLLFQTRVTSRGLWRSRMITGCSLHAMTATTSYGTSSNVNKGLREIVGGW